MGLVLATMALVAGCGSSTTVGTGDGPATTIAGEPVADLSSCAHVVGAEVSVAGGATGSPSPTAALHDFLATNATGRALRTATFEVAKPPPSDQPIQMVGNDGETTTVVTPDERWFVHLGTDGRPTAVAGVVHMGSGGWIVTDLELCQLGAPNGATATTGAGSLTADLSCSSDEGAVAGAMMSTGTDATGAATATQAVHDYLVTSPAVTPPIASLRTATFEPASRPRSDEPVQAVTSAGTVPAVAVGGTGAVSTDLTTTTSAIPNQWFVHRGADGRVTAVIEVSNHGTGWIVGTFEYCMPGVGAPGGTTRTTASTTVMGGG